MCGIVGQVRPRGTPAAPGLAERMCALLEHRGPDARGIHCEGNVVLGIQRLRVIDLDTGDQPIYNEDRSVVVILNGEIYNYRELGADLRRRGHQLTSNGDTEVIAHLYEEYGVDCVRRLHGMFAFALWDARRQQLLLARDRVAGCAPPIPPDPRRSGAAKPRPAPAHIAGGPPTCKRRAGSHSS